MYLTAVFVILFKISLGFHLNFGLAQLLHDLSTGNAPLFNIGSSKESKPTESNEALKVETALNSSISKNAGVTGNLKTSVSVNSSNLEDSLKGVSGEATKALDGVLEKVGETTGKLLKDGVLESSLETVSNKQSDALDSTLGTISGKVSKVLEENKSGDSLKSATEKVGKVLQADALKGPAETISEKVKETLDRDIVKDSEKSLTAKAGKASSGNVLEGVLDNVPGKVGKITDSSNLQGSLKTLQRKAGEVLDGKNLEGSLEIPSGEDGKAVDAGNLEDAVKSLPGKASEVLQGSVSESASDDESEILDTDILEGSVKALSDKAGKIADASILKGAVKTVSDKAGKTVQGISETVSGKAGKTLDVDKIIPSGDLEGSLETISEKPQKASQGSLLDMYMGAAADQAGKLLPGISLEDPLGKVSDRVKKALNGSASVKAQAIESIGGSLKQGIPEKVLGKSPNLNINTEVSIGCVASSLANVPAISTFIKTCHKAVLSSKLLIILFNITDVTALQFSRFKYRHFADVFRKLGIIDGNEISTLAVRHIAQYFEVISPEVLVKFYTSFLAFFLFSEGILVDANAEKLAFAWIKAMTESSDANDVICDCDSTRKLQATSEGNASFLFSVVEMTKSQAWAIAFYYAHTWLLAAVEQGSLRVLGV